MWLLQLKNSFCWCGFFNYNTIISKKSIPSSLISSSDTWSGQYINPNLVHFPVILIDSSVWSWRSSSCNMFRHDDWSCWSWGFSCRWSLFFSLKSFVCWVCWSCCSSVAVASAIFDYSMLEEILMKTRPGWLSRGGFVCLNRQLM